ncbi:hypothetical protein [Pseudonocardia sp. GCM10023141]|uniref:hypothetical protein n=1 Tax=Pseudonocardia sp. GCM10023141 TaxID=3252653 RepID=UPI00361E4BF2
MLLLVLIIVLIAFGLLVVALLSGSVLMAWVSVGMSVIAAVVLLVDWLQRRSAVKAGAGPDAVAGALSAASAPPRLPDYEPATEILPVVPASGQFGQAGQRTGAPESNGVGEQPTSVVDSRFDQGGDGQQTVVMPVVQPSGSAARPSGAEGSITSSSGNSSPSAVKTGDERAPSVPGSSEAGAPATDTPDDSDSPDNAADKLYGSDAYGSDAESTVKVDVRKGSAKDAAPDAAKDVDAVPAKDSGLPVRTEAPTVLSAVPLPSGADLFGTAPPQEQPPELSKTPEGAAPPAEPAQDSGLVEDVPLFGSSSGSSTTSGSSIPAEPVGLSAAEEPVGDADSEGEAPEEPHDAVAAALVATLEDEVVVVDEQPRYHVVECRSLVTAQVIPLPVREAVELGFTPCGWCSPDHTLSSRHQTASS